MIKHLASPSVCVVDDEKSDYQPILRALNSLYIGAVHFKGDLASLPSTPFNKLRLVFLDLHLSADIGKNAASHTANVFAKLVSVKTAPVVVVIWSKYAKDQVEMEGVPPDDQETEAALFRRTLIEAHPEYEGRLIFIEMPKPKPRDRQANWQERLKAEISKSLKGKPAIETLWAWDSLVQEECTMVSSEITSTTQTAINGTGRDLSDGLKNAMQSLVQAQGKGNIAAETAPIYLAGVFSNLLSDRLERSDNSTFIANHGHWLSKPPSAPLGPDFASHMSSLLMAADAGTADALYLPGTVYSLNDETSFKNVFGEELSSLIDICCKDKPQTEKWQAWKAAVKPVAVEISPACDVAQNKRINALLVAGLIVPTSICKTIKTAGFITTTASFKVHWDAEDWVSQNAILLVCHQYKFTTPHKNAHTWLKPWFRLRELPASAIRSANAAYAARVGYVSVE